MTIPKPPSQLGCKWVENCTEICHDPSVYVEDRGIRATFRNPKGESVRKIHYDGCYNIVADVGQADFIVGKIDILDVIVELKSSDTNIKEAAGQIDHTLHFWRQDARRYRRISALIIYGSIQGAKKRPGRRPRANSMVQSVERDFLATHGILLLIHENGEKQFSFNDFLRKNDAH